MEFLILEISQMSKVSFIATYFVMDCLFGSGLTPLASTFELNIIVNKL